MSRLEIVRPRQSTRWQRMVESLRSYWVAGQPIRDPLIGPTWDGQRSITGVSVSEHTALNYSPVWAAVNLISGDISRVPLFLYKRTPDGRGKERFNGHPLYKLIHQSPNPFCDSMQFRRTLQAWALVWGNGFAEIERDGGGRPTNLWPIEPCRVTLFLNGAGDLRYNVSNTGAPDDVYLPSDMLHIRGLGTEYEGHSLIARARETVGLGLAAERFGGALFGNGATMGGTLTHPGRLSTEARENLRNSLNARHQGVDRAHKFVILEEGMTYETLGIPPDHAQFLETRQFQLNEVARWFNLPPHKIGDLLRSTNNNIEQQSIDYTTQTLEPWFETWKHELEHKLISPSERGQQVIDHEKKSLLSGDQAGRSAFYTALYTLGAITANEIRAAENMNPLPGGDTAFVQLNMTPAEKAGEFVDAQIKQMTAKAEAPAPATPGGVRDALISDLTDRLTAAEARAAARDAELAGAVALHDSDIRAVKDSLVRQTELSVSLESDVITKTTERDEAMREADAAEVMYLAAKARAETAESDRDVSVADANGARESLRQAEARAVAAHAHATVTEIALLESHEARNASGKAVDALNARVDALLADVARVEQERADHAQARAAAEGRLKEAADVAGELERSLIETREFVVAIKADHEATIALVTEAQARADAEAVARQQEADARAAAEQAAKEAQAEAERQRVFAHDLSIVAQAGVDKAREEATEARDLADAERAARQAEMQARIEAERIAKQAVDDAALIAEMRDQTTASLQAAQREVTDAMTRAQEAEASAAQLRDQVTLAESVLFTANTDHATAVATMRDALSALERERDEAKTTAALLEARAVAAETEHRNVKRAELDRMAATIGAHRALIVDAIGRMVRRETAKARGQQATPQKLRRWLATFETVHEPLCVEALLPAIRTHLAWTRADEDPQAATKYLVKAHIAAFIAAVAAAADSDPDEFPSVLEAVLQGWEANRPDAVADDILRKEIEHVRAARY